MVEWQRFRFAVAVATLFAARDVAAQGTRGKPPPVSSAPILASAGDAAEQRMRAGDCTAALDAFDAALRSAINPELRRDRGKCHEKLGHPFPAIEDYRAYLVRRPNAPDSDAIRARVAALEAQVGIVKAGQAGVSDKSGAAVSTSIGGETDTGTPAGGAGSSIEALERDEQLEAQAEASALRRGHGFILALVVGGRYFSNSAFGGAELAGFDLRYSFSRASTIMVEVSVGRVNTGGTATALTGPGILGGYELRIPLNPRVSDALLLGATFRYESLSQSNALVYPVLEPEGRFGYRHVFGPSLGLEAVADGGVAFASVNGLPNSGTTQALVGGHVALVMGF